MRKKRASLTAWRTGEVDPKQTLPVGRERAERPGKLPSAEDALLDGSPWQGFSDLRLACAGSTGCLFLS